MNFSFRNICIYVLITFIIKAIWIFFFIKEFHLWEDHWMAEHLISQGEMFSQFEKVKSHSSEFPVYPFLLSCIYSLFGEKPALAVLYNILLQSVSALLLYQISNLFLQFFSIKSFNEAVQEKISFFTAVIFSIYPPLCWYSMYNVHPLSENIFFLLLLLFCTAKYIQTSSGKWFAACCLTAGIAVLDRNSLATGTIPLIIWTYCHDHFKNFIKKTGILFLTIFLIGLPWILSNYYREGRFSYTIKEGRCLYIGSIPELKGGTSLDSGSDYTAVLSRSEKDSLSELSVKQQDDFFMKKFIAQIKKDPAGYIKLYFIKLKNFWLFRPQAGNIYSKDLQSLLPYYLVLYFIILSLSFIGLVFSRRKGWYLFIVPVALSLFQSVFYVETRHRMLIEPILIFFAITAISALYESRRRSA